MLKKGKNSYVALSEAERYILQMHSGSAQPRQAWDSLPGNTDKMRFLLKACTMIDALQCPGRKADPRQALEFPRSGALSVPDDICHAQIELALWLAQQASGDNMRGIDRAELIAQGVTSFRIDDLAETFDGGKAAPGAMQCQAAALLLKKHTGGVYTLC